MAATSPVFRGCPRCGGALRATLVHGLRAVACEHCDAVVVTRSDLDRLAGGGFGDLTEEGPTAEGPRGSSPRPATPAVREPASPQPPLPASAPAYTGPARTAAPRPGTPRPGTPRPAPVAPGDEEDDFPTRRSGSPIGLLGGVAIALLCVMAVVLGIALGQFFHVPRPDEVAAGPVLAPPTPLAPGTPAVAPATPADPATSAGTAPTSAGTTSSGTMSSGTTSPGTSAEGDVAAVATSSEPETSVAPAPAPAPAKASPTKLVRKGWDLLDKGDVAGGEQAFRQAIALAPYEPESHYGLGYALIREQKNDEAAEELCTALRSSPAVDMTRDVMGLLDRIGKSCK